MANIPPGSAGLCLAFSPSAGETPALPGRLHNFLIICVFLASLVPGIDHARALEAMTNEWSVRIGSPIDSSPAIAPDGTIYFGTWKGKLWALKPSGATKWTFTTDVEIRSSPAVGVDGTIYFGCRDRKFYALEPNGKRKWEFKTGGWVDCSPAIAQDGMIYFGSWDKYFYAVNPNGSKKWQFATLGAIISSPAVGSDGTIYFGSHDAKFYALTPDGRKKWEFATGGQIASSPAFNKDEWLCFTSSDGFCYALNFDGTKRWALATGSMTQASPVIGEDGTIYLGVNEHMWAITPSGQKKWEQPAPYDKPFEATPLVLADGTICHISRYGMMMDVEPERSQLKWMFFVSQQGYASPAVGPQGTIYIPSDGSGFTALKNSVPLARSAWPKFRGNPRNTGRAGDW
jgi:outer membrane protein assembly factor BamB